MRDLIDLVTPLTEARRAQPKRPPPVDTSGFVLQIRTLMHRFANLGVRYNVAWSEKAKQLTAEQAERERQAADPEDENQFDQMAYMETVIDRVWEHFNGFYAVRKNIEHEEHEYQRRSAERHDRLDDPDFYIESSDFLHAMQAEARCAVMFASTHSLTDPATVQQVIQGCETFLDEWENHMHPNEGEEGPILDGDFIENIACTMPLMLMAARLKPLLASGNS
jgi:hypothetical protein